MRDLTYKEFVALSKVAEGAFSCILEGQARTCSIIGYYGNKIAAWIVKDTRMVIRRPTMNEPNFDGSNIHVENNEGIGPQLDVNAPHTVEVKFNGKTLWINIDEVCRLRVSRASEIKFDCPGFTQREVE